ncbi:hypothetical protein LZF95_13175 [Algoriphagus sp. AGSA1]|uniref:hypothetical protein n=1 Tax=Algoriphagus sp. AGSA1 TaxID=2907213 RepID=UPI001F1976BB|nr:hypothetical protein [Algoriphagus sp. AGSA1]MCE7055632.1 hypothetical protein [Algoriphagus sp. AGSA1]
MKRLLIAAIMLVAQFAVAQISNVNMNGVPARITSYTGIEGSPYLFQDWAKADIGTTNAGLKEDVAYRFNVHDNELEVINEAGNTIYLDKDYVEYAVLQRPSILMATGQEGVLPNLLFKKGFDMVKGVGSNDLVNVIAEGKKYTLVRKYYSDLITPPVNSYAPSPGKMFVFEENFFLIDSNENVQSVKNKTKSVLKALREEDQARAKELIKENKLDLSREDHLMVFFQKLNDT